MSRGDHPLPAKTALGKGRSNSGESSQADGSSQRSALAQFYAAEYSAIMARITLWTTLQYSLWPIVIVALTMLAGLKGSLPTIVLVWAGASVFPVAYIAFQSAMIDALSSVLMIEAELRPLAAELTSNHSQSFWIHERYHRKKREPNAAFWAYWPPVISFGSGVATFVYRWFDPGVSRGDYLGLAASCILAGFVLFLTLRGTKIDAGINAAVRKEGRPSMFLEASRSSTKGIDAPRASR